MERNRRNGWMAGMAILLAMAIALIVPGLAGCQLFNVEGDAPGVAEVEQPVIVRGDDGRELMELSIRVSAAADAGRAAGDSRALSSALAKAGINYYEVIFSDGTKFYRTAWYKGQTARLAVPPETYDGAPGGKQAILLAGTNNAGTAPDFTLLAVGKLTSVTNGAASELSQVITTNTTGVTFTLFALEAAPSLDGATSAFRITGPAGYETPATGTANIPAATVAGKTVPYFKAPERTTGITAEYAIGILGTEPVYSGGTSTSLGDYLTVKTGGAVTSVGLSSANLLPVALDVGNGSATVTNTGDLGDGMIHLEIDTPTAGITKGLTVIGFDLPVAGLAGNVPGGETWHVRGGFQNHVLDTITGAGPATGTPNGGILLAVGDPGGILITVNPRDLFIRVAAGSPFLAPQSSPPSTMTVTYVNGTSVTLNREYTLPNGDAVYAAGRPAGVAAGSVLYKVNAGGSDILLGRKDSAPVTLQLDAAGAVEPRAAIVSGQPHAGFVPVGSVAELHLITANPGDNYYLETDLDLLGNAAYTAVPAAVQEWLPIGKNAGGTDSPFLGTFDGNHKNLSNMRITPANLASQTNAIGLFSVVGEQSGTRAIIENLTVRGEIDVLNTTTEISIGGVAAIVENGSIRNCNNYVALTLEPGGTIGSGTGGIIGWMVDGEVIDCANYAALSSTDGHQDSNTGGIVSIIMNGTNAVSISGCANYGDIVINEYVSGIAGGILGCNAGDQTTITACKNSGSVMSGNYAGGIIGKGVDVDTTITACYNTGDINATPGGAAGGIAGAAPRTFFSACYSAGSVTAPSGDRGGIAGTVASNTCTFNSNCFYDGRGGTISGTITGNVVNGERVRAFGGTEVDAGANGSGGTGWPGVTLYGVDAAADNWGTTALTSNPPAGCYWKAPLPGYNTGGDYPRLYWE